MKREWQPGDVAMVRNEWNVWNVAICTLREGRPGWWWRYGVADSWSPIANPDVRPLVVIDPEDREQVERLVRMWLTAYDGCETKPRDTEIDAMRSALRDLANPTPRIEEPAGLGAVIEAIYDNRFIHVGNGCWLRVGDANQRTCEYADISAVRVLSEGVTE